MFYCCCVQDSPTEEAAVATPPAAVPEKREGTSGEQVADKLEGVTFEARVVIHEALHLPLLKDSK